MAVASTTVHVAASPLGKIGMTYIAMVYVVMTYVVKAYLVLGP